MQKCKQNREDKHYERKQLIIFQRQLRNSNLLNMSSQEKITNNKIKSAKTRAMHKADNKTKKKNK